MQISTNQFTHIADAKVGRVRCGQLAMLTPTEGATSSQTPSVLLAVPRCGRLVHPGSVLPSSVTRLRGAVACVKGDLPRRGSANCVGVIRRSPEMAVGAGEPDDYDYRTITCPPCG